MGDQRKRTIKLDAQGTELLFRCPHHSIDGTGVLLFWQSYLSAIASPLENISFGTEAARLAPAFEEAIGYSSEPTAAQNEEAAALFMSWAGSIPGIGPIFKVGIAPSVSCHNTELVFSAETTAALVTACKTKGVTVTSVVHAAYIKALVKHADPNGKTSST